MTDRTELDLLRTLAKQLARGARIPHHQALDMIASQCGQPHWNALVSAWRDGWRPTPEQIDRLIEPDESEDLEPPVRWVGSVERSQGNINGEPYELEIGFDDVLVGGKGWCVYLGHAPSEAATIERYGKPNPLDDDAFFAEIMKIANAAADKVRIAISHDWPRRSTKPDAAGGAQHPLFKNMYSAEWHCLHCDAKSTSAQMASNMWHCPECSATPLDMFPTPWWKGDHRQEDQEQDASPTSG